MTQQPFALCFENLTKTYASGTQALKGVSFTVARGEFFGLLGPNGAGKTTLISMLAGLTKPTSGTLWVDGLNPQKHRHEAARRLGIVPQEVTYEPTLTVRETLEYQSGYWGIRGNDAWIDEILTELALLDKANQRVRQLSGGMKRRVLVAQALVHRPDIIVLDEPTAGVDVELREQLWRFIGRLHQAGHTVILTTHYLEEAQQYCERLAIMNRGELVKLDKTENLLANYGGEILSARFTPDVPETLRARIVRRHGHEASLSVESTNDVAHILNLCQQHGVVVENLSVTQPKLEDVFLELTQNTTNKKD